MKNSSWHIFSELRQIHRATGPEGNRVSGQVLGSFVSHPLRHNPLVRGTCQGSRKPTGVWAVGQANHNNPVSIIVPCHRVIGANGTLTGYGGGLSMKEKLLRLERGEIHTLFPYAAQSA